MIRHPDVARCHVNEHTPTEADRARARELRLIHDAARAHRRAAMAVTRAAGLAPAPPGPAKEPVPPAKQRTAARGLAAPISVPEVAAVPLPPAARPAAPTCGLGSPRAGSLALATPAGQTAPDQHRPPAAGARSTRSAARSVVAAAPEPEPTERVERPAGVKRCPAASQVRSAPLLAAAEATFYADRQARCCTAATLAGYRSDIGRFLSWLEAQAVTEPAQITVHHIRQYLLEAQDRGVSVWTVHHYGRAVRTFCNFLVSEEIIDDSPMRKLRLPRLPKTLLPAFTREEVQRLLQAAQDGAQPVRDTAILLVLLDTGCRAREFLALTSADVDLERGQLAVRQGKGRKARVTYVGTRAGAALGQYLQQRSQTAGQEPLWVTAEGKGLTTSGLRQLLDRLAHRAGLADVHPHKFRRTCALWSLRAGMHVYALQMMLGHESLEMLRRYLALIEADVEQQHRAHGAVDGLL